METSIFIARLLAIIYLALGLGMLLNQAYYKKAIGDMMKDAGTMYLGGAVALVVGFLIVSYHNVWEQSWVVLITIIGWLAIIKGAVLLVFPQALMNPACVLSKQKNIKVWTVIALILGLVFAYYGFVV